MRYDPVFHITARELRKMGMSVPDRIPDQAFVARDSRQVLAGVPVEDDEHCWSFPMVVRYTEPFRWIDTEYLPALVVDAPDREATTVRIVVDRRTAHKP
jgi:hypothetical protein